MSHNTKELDDHIALTKKMFTEYENLLSKYGVKQIFPSSVFDGSLCAVFHDGYTITLPFHIGDSNG